MGVRFEVTPRASDAALNALVASIWPEHTVEPGLVAQLGRHSLSYGCAFDAAALTGFGNLAWDGNRHGFVLDTSVHSNYRRQGIGRQPVATAADLARVRGLAWLPVDNEPHPDMFYRACGFDPTAGLIRLTG